MTGHHFFTIDPNPVPLAKSQGTACYVFKGPVVGTLPLFSWYNPSTEDHFYTTVNTGEIAPATGYQSKGVLCYVFSSPRENSVPLFRWWNASNNDHFYTCEGLDEKALPGYVSESIACYVLQSPQSVHQDAVIPLFRWYIPFRRPDPDR